MSSSNDDQQPAADPVLQAEGQDHLHDMLLQVRSMKFPESDKTPRHLIYYMKGDQLRHEADASCWCAPTLVDAQDGRPPVFMHRRSQ